MAGVTVALLGLLATATAGAAETDRDVSAIVRGSTSLAPFMQQAAEGYMGLHPETLISVLPSSTDRAYKGLLEGTIDLGVVGQEMDADQRKEMQARRLNLIFKPLGHDGVAFIVNPANPVTGLSKDSLNQILTGAVRSWSDVGGGSGAIKTLLQPTSLTVVDMVKETIVTRGYLSPHALFLAEPAVAAKVAGDVDAIGAVTTAALSGRVRAIAIDGQLPTPEALKAGNYPMIRQLNVVYADTAPHTVADFAKYLLDPKGGQKYLAAAGAVPLQ